MPRQLASKKQYAGWNFQPNVSFPKSIEKWMMLVSTFVRHCLARYGASDVHTWYFDFWVCPDLKLHNGYWNESMEKFFEFYLATYRAVKGVSPLIQIGSPTFSTPGGLSWYEAFFDFCRTQSIDPDFISAHMYSINITTEQHEFVSYSSTRTADQDASDKTSILRQVSAIKAIMAEHGYQDKPLLLSHWNVSFLPRDLSRDTSFMGPYFAYNQSALLREVSGMCFRSLSDVNEDFSHTAACSMAAPACSISMASKTRLSRVSVFHPARADDSVPVRHAPDRQVGARLPDPDVLSLLL